MLVDSSSSTSIASEISDNDGTDTDDDDDDNDAVRNNTDDGNLSDASTLIIDREDPNNQIDEGQGEF